MSLPPKISFLDVEPSPALRTHIEQRAEKLVQLFPRIVSCRVAIEAPRRHNLRGRSYQARIDVVVPRAELAVGDHRRGYLQRDCHVAIDQAFDEMERRLADHARIMRGEVKTHEPMPRARVRRVFVDRGFGFLVTDDGREVYFHENSVVRDRFADLEPGMEVHFVEEEGEQGAQASTVELLHPRRRSTQRPIEEDRPSLSG